MANETEMHTRLSPFDFTIFCSETNVPMRSRVSPYYSSILEQFIL